MKTNKIHNKIHGEQFNIRRQFLRVSAFLCAFCTLFLLVFSVGDVGFVATAAPADETPSERVFLGENGHFYSVDFEKGVASLLLGQKTAEYAEIPETLEVNGNSYPVTAVAQGAFLHNAYLKEIVLPDSVVSIESGAFFGCVSLEKVVAKGLTSAGTSVFSGTPFITSGEFVTLGEVLFRYNGESENVIIPSGVSFAADAFAYNTFVKNVVVPEGVRTLGDGFFACAENLVSVVLPSSLERIGDKAFFGCVSLEEINVGENVARVGENAFSGTPYLAGLLETEEEFVVVGGGVLLKYKGDKVAATVPEEVVSISDAFAYSSVSSVELPDGCSIGNGAFKGASKLSKVTVKGDCGGIFDYAFADCTNLRLLTFEGNFTGAVERFAFKGVSKKLSVYYRDGMNGFGAFEKAGIPAASPDRIKAKQS